MSKDTTEEVIARDVYEVGMTVRLRNGETIDDLEAGIGTWGLNSDSAVEIWRDDGTWSINEGEKAEYDIIGEVVTAPAAVVATKPAATFDADERRVYNDDMVTHNGMVDGMTMDDALEARRYADRAISRLKRDGKHYGWEV